MLATPEERTPAGACRLCGNASGNTIYHAREMFFGTRDPFDYAECGACGVVQITRVPDLGHYYPKDYYSFQPTGDTRAAAGLKGRLARGVDAFIRRRAAAYYCGRRARFGEYRYPVGRRLAKRLRGAEFRFPDYLKDAAPHLGLTRKAAILDLGSGVGGTLLTLRHFGFRDLTGVDPFIESDIFYGDGVRVLKAGLSDLGRQFDLIIANHSLEHIPDPRATLRDIHRLLKPGRYAIVRIPVLAYAWRKYRADWVQLDPPRHIFLFPARTFAALAEEEGYQVDDLRHDSWAFQFWGSEQYMRDIPLTDERSYYINPEKSLFTPAQITTFALRAKELNAQGDGDQAVFYLRKVRPTLTQ